MVLLHRGLCIDWCPYEGVGLPYGIEVGHGPN
jgi:hypothetical protein